MPDTTEYLIYGLGVVFSVLIAYGGFLALLFRSKLKDLETLEQLYNEE